VIFRRRKSKQTRGAVEIQPVGKGVVFLSGPHKGKYVDDVIEELNEDITGNGHLTLTIEWDPREDLLH